MIINSKRAKRNEILKGRGNVHIAFIANTEGRNEKGLSTGEKKMLTNAKQILVSELVLAEHSNKDEMEEMVDNKINNSFITFRAADTVKESVVSKFIPFDGGSTSENT